jgi:hypothetical protein
MARRSSGQRPRLTRRLGHFAGVASDMQSNSGTDLLTLGEAAKRLQWSVRTLRSRLRDYGIGTMGRGRIARVTEQDFARLIEAERQFVPAPSPGVNPADREALRIARMRQTRRISGMVSAELAKEKGRRWLH